MEPTNLRFGGGSAETMLTPLTAVLMLIAIVLILVLPRRSVIACFLTGCLCMPIAQVVVLGGVHFTVLRILIITGMIRRVIDPGQGKKGKYPGGINGMDLTIIFWAASEMTVVSLQWMNAQAMIHNLGDFLDAFGGYLVVRYLIPDEEAIYRTIKVLAVICAIQGACMLGEQTAHLNVFRYLGGNQHLSYRDDKIRSEGVMGCLYAGSFAGVTMPLFVWLWSVKRNRKFGWIGLAGAVLMVLTANSSTPLLAVAAGVLGLLFWPLRRSMRQIRWALGLTLTALHLVMHAPVWSLIARIDLTGSSSSYHRYYLIDKCINHFSYWWLLGYRYYDAWGWDMWDLSDQFVVAALTGGLVTLVLYISIFVRGFSALGTARRRVAGERGREWLIWCLGADLFANVVAQFGINYMAQMMMTLFPLLAFISVVLYSTKNASVPAKRIQVPAHFASSPAMAS